MKNVRVEGDELVYDCGGLECPTPDVPHRISLKKVMASLEATYKEFMYHRDPRTEAVDAAMQYLFQTLFAEGMDGRTAPIGTHAPWNAEFKALLGEIDDNYDDAPLQEKQSPKKEYLN